MPTQTVCYLNQGIYTVGECPNTNDYSLSNISNPVGKTIVDDYESLRDVCFTGQQFYSLYGLNSLGEFGNGQTSSTANHSWNFVPNLDPEIIDLGSYRQKFCALNSSGSLLCWGVTNYYAGSTYQSTATQIEYTVNSARILENSVRGRLIVHDTGNMLNLSNFGIDGLLPKNVILSEWMDE